jgi:hypothetical protein
MPDALQSLQAALPRTQEDVRLQVGGQRSLSFLRDVINRVKGEVERYVVIRMKQSQSSSVDLNSHVTRISCGGGKYCRQHLCGESEE